MSVFDRPYAGSWSPNRKKVNRYTPDAILFLNGDTNIPGHKPEKQVIDIQQYVTQMSCDAGVESGSCSASFTLSIPRDIGSSLFSDGHCVFQPGLEVHIYMRGYFPVEGLANTLAKDELQALKDLLGDQSANLALRPYYHCFHGVTTTANLEYSGGFYSINQSCTGMLHFWQYHDISTNASLFGTRPSGSKLKMSLVGHNFTNMSPFSIVYSLYKDTAGSAGGVAFALSSSSNQSKKFFSENRSLFEMSALYWQKRFETKMYNLRMFGVNGEQLNSTQTAMIGRMSTGQLRAAAEINLRHKNNAAMTAANPTGTQILGADPEMKQLDMKGSTFTNKNWSNAMLQYLERAGEKSGYAVSAAQLKAFVNDIGQWGNVNLFESSYTSKLDIATAAATAVGYEFFQDVDGDLVFKPPLYNMDTSDLEAYRIEPEEIISITRASAEPQCTYMTVKSGAFSNWKGLGLEGEWGIRGQYIDYRLVGKYGWRPGDFDAQFYSDARGAFWAAVARMDIINEAMETANIVIPLRPELRPGFPVYVKHLDCFYYVKSMSHSFSYGGQCTTTLQCVAKRSKFLPPGINVPKDDNWGSNGIAHVRLSRPDMPSVPLIINQGTTGEVKLVGYPNVVMALDPNAISPLTWAFGQDVVDLTNPAEMKNLLMLLTGRDSKHPITEGSYYKDFTGKNGQVVRLAGGGAVTDSTIAAIFDNDKPPTGGFSVAVFDKAADGGRKATWSMKQISFAEIREQMLNYQDFLEEQNEKPATGEATLPGSKAWEQANADYKAAFNTAVYGDAAGTTGATIFDLLDLVGAFKVEDEDALNSAAIMDLLGDKKANFSNASTPGYYRYWSSAAPDEDDQAPSHVYKATNSAYGLERTMKDSDKVMNTYSSGMFKSKTETLTPPASIRSSASLLGRYVEWDSSSTKEVRQFRVAGSGGNYRDVHTDDIHTLKFSTGAVELQSMVAITSRTVTFHKDETIKAYANQIETWLNNTVGTIPLDSTMADAYDGVFAQMWNLAFPGGGLMGNPAFFNLTPPGGASKPVTNFINGGSSFDQTNDNGPLPISKNFPAFQWSNTYGGAYRLGLADRDAAYASQSVPGAGISGGKKNFDLSGVELGDIRRRLHCWSGCKCYMMDDNLRVKEKPQKVDRYDVALQAKHIKADILSEALHKHVAKRMAKRVLKLLSLAASAWHNEFKSKTKYPKTFNSDEAKKAWLEFGTFTKEFNAAIGMGENKQNIAELGGWKKKYKTKGKFKKVTSIYSPIFPISDAGGYKHFGSYAYGRGVTLDTSGEGWERLLSQDPLDEVDKDVVDTFVREILKSGSKKITKKIYEDAAAGAVGSDGVYRSNSAVVEALMEMQRTNPAAFARAARSLKIKDDDKVITVQEYIDKYPEDGRSKAGWTQKVLAIGLINHYQRDDTPGSYTTPLNASHNLVDIMPMKGTKPSAGDEILWDSLVRMNAGDPNSFLYVAPTGGDGTLQANVVKMVQQDMIENAATHAQYQGELRGKKEKPRQEFDFRNILADWGIGEGKWEDTLLGGAVDKFSQIGSANPDDPEIAAALKRVRELKKDMKEKYTDGGFGDLYGNSEGYKEKEAAAKAAAEAAAANNPPPNAPAGNDAPTAEGGVPDDNFDPEPEDETIEEPSQDPDAPSDPGADQGSSGDGTGDGWS